MQNFFQTPPWNRFVIPVSSGHIAPNRTSPHFGGMYTVAIFYCLFEYPDQDQENAVDDQDGSKLGEGLYACDQ